MKNGQPNAEAARRLSDAFDASDFERHRDLAEKVDVSEAHISRWFRGVHEPTRKHKRSLARALKVSIEEIWPRV